MSVKCLECLCPKDQEWLEQFFGGILYNGWISRFTWVMEVDINMIEVDKDKNGGDNLSSLKGLERTVWKALS